MKTKDFEKAVEASGCELLLLQYDGGNVAAAYGAVHGTMTYVKWDDMGRAFVYVQQEGTEDCVSEYNLTTLPYERDSKFDLEFE